MSTIPMKAKHITSLFLVMLFSTITLKAQQDSSKMYFQQAFNELTEMLEGKNPLSFERAIFITENAYRGNSISYTDFQAALDIHGSVIEQLIKANDNYDWKKLRGLSMGIPTQTDEQAKETYRKALANWAIYTYLTDTTKVKIHGVEYDHLPFTYSTNDPFGTIEWKNSQVINLLETQKGNCYALVALFKIFSERFNTEANIVTAPQHIYIEHRDPKGDLYNVELATRSFPGTGSIEVLTYTTREAVMNDIALRSLDLKQSVGLNLVYLAKGFEYKYKTKDDPFLLDCAEQALAHDAKNLNAMLLKAQVYEQRVMKKEMPSAPYENMLAAFYKLGYRKMPDDMKNIIMAKIQGRPIHEATDKTPATISGQSRYVTLSNGLFEEVHVHQNIIRYGQTIFDTEEGKIVKFLEENNFSYQVDPVVFALSVDPLTAKYPELTPYQFAGNMPIKFIDLDGLEPANPGKDADSQRGAIDNIYKCTGGDEKFDKQPLPKQIGDYSEKVDKSSFVMNPVDDKYKRKVNENSQFLIKDESKFPNDKALINFLLGNFAWGEGPENYVFPTDGKFAKSLSNSYLVDNALIAWSKDGAKDDFAMWNGMGIYRQQRAFWDNLGVLNLENFLGSAGVKINKIDDKQIMITIFNTTSLTSGDLTKHLYPFDWGYGKSRMRGPLASFKTPYGNISQTFKLTMSIEYATKHVKEIDPNEQ
jgi:hypothetical protein